MDHIAAARGPARQPRRAGRADGSGDPPQARGQHGCCRPRGPARRARLRRRHRGVGALVGLSPPRAGRRGGATQCRGDPAHHDVRRRRLPDRLLPRPLRPGPELDRDRQVARRTTTRRARWTCRTTAARPGRSDFDYLEVADEVARRSGSGGRRRPGHARRALHGRQGGDGARPAHAERWCERLCVVDVAPVRLRLGRRVRGLHRGHARARPRRARSRRADADAPGTRQCPTETVREFLLQNLSREGSDWRWQANLEVLGARAARSSAGWPSEQLADAAPYDGPVLWVAGADSRYMRRRARDAMGRSSRARARWSSRTPATGCTPSSPRSSSRCCRRLVGVSRR